MARIHRIVVHNLGKYSEIMRIETPIVKETREEKYTCKQTPYY